MNTILQVTPQIRFQGMEPSPALEATIADRIARLSQFHERITGCTVVVQAPHRHGRKGQVYHVRIDLVVPGREIVVGREPEADHAHEDPYVAVRDGFDAAERQLADAVREMTPHRVKTASVRLQGTIARLLPGDDFGFISLPEGREVFFRRESLTSPSQWNALKEGSEVRFTEHEGDKGPYASAVTLL